jgi:hypothetical protein
MDLEISRAARKGNVNTVTPSVAADTKSKPPTLPLTSLTNQSDKYYFSSRLFTKRIASPPPRAVVQNHLTRRPDGPHRRHHTDRDVNAAATPPPIFAASHETPPGHLEQFRYTSKPAHDNIPV